MHENLKYFPSDTKCELQLSDFTITFLAKLAPNTGIILDCVWTCDSPIPQTVETKLVSALNQIIGSPGAELKNQLQTQLR